MLGKTLALVLHGKRQAELSLVKHEGNYVTEILNVQVSWLLLLPGLLR